MPHYGDEPGVKFYTHLSDRYAPFHTKVIAATASEAAHVLDGLLDHQSEVAARRHHTDGGGDSDHVFALCSLRGFQFAPRIPDLKSRRLYRFDKAAYPSLEPLIAGRINTALIRAHWPEILGVAASIHTGTVGRLLPAAKRPRRGAARTGAAGTDAVHPRLAGGCDAAQSQAAKWKAWFLGQTLHGHHAWLPRSRSSRRRHGRRSPAGRARGPSSLVPEMSIRIVDAGGLMDVFCGRKCASR
jgi:hypothetical protein